jgi:hypothetical protein
MRAAMIGRKLEERFKDRHESSMNARIAAGAQNRPLTPQARWNRHFRMAVTAR